MRIHIYSRSFAPALGGTERLMELLAREFATRGHDVTVVTETRGEADFPFPVVRAPSFRRALALARASDAILAAPLSLRRLPVHFLARRPIVVAHPILYIDSGRHALPALLKRLFAKFVTSVVPSQFMARHFARAIVVPNPYDTGVFEKPASDFPKRDVLFVGRLVPEKGCDLLIRGFAAFGGSVRLSIVGEGPERVRLELLAEELGILSRIDFCGELAGVPLAKAMQAHAVMVVPTLCEEAFGIVALEGLASGCRMIVAQSGGLPEAVGSFALTFPRGDVAALAACLKIACSGDDQPPPRREVEAHLKNFSPERIAQKYLEIIDRP